MTTDGHVAYFTRTGNPTYTQEIITFQEKETLNDDGLFKDSNHKLQDDQSDKTWQFQDSKDMQISRNRWRFGTVLFTSTTVLCLVVTIYFATSSSNKSKNTHGHSSLQQKTENITNYKGFTETNGHTTKEDACVSSPCLNGGTCVTAGCSYYCICPKGITGYKCAVTPCTSSPCLNNGECKVKNDTYQCHCPVGFHGPECQGVIAGMSVFLSLKNKSQDPDNQNTLAQVTPCHSSPCSNGGECTPTGSSFVCSCTTGYFGSQCQGTPCHSSPCLNRGTCKPSGSSFFCSCPTEYSGKQCQITPCRSSPCSNGGKCTPTGSSFVCSCPTGYFGNQCQGTPCHSSPCSNRGTCKPSGSSFVCSCRTGYSGKQCQVTPCHSSPCLNGGRCTSTNSGFVCSCQTGFSGNRCQIRPPCPYGWKMNEIKCYYFSNESTNWYSAKSYCQRRGSMLAEVTTRSKMRFLRTNAQVNGETFWLGGSDQAYEGLWRWTTSRQGFTVTDWHTRTIHEPNNLDGNEDCLNIHKKLDFEWNDDKCSNHYRFICEKSLI